MNTLDVPSSWSRPLRLMLADDHESVRQGLRALFRAFDNIDIVEEAADASSILGAVERLQPDVLVTDLSMPGISGLGILRRLQSLHTRVKVVVLTRHREIFHVQEAFAAGACGYVLKHSSFAELQLAIESALRDQRHLDSSLLDSLDIESLSRRAPTPTKRELAVLQRAALGDSNVTIAASLAIAVKTVEAHKANGMRRLGLECRRDLIEYAVVHRWFDD